MTSYERPGNDMHLKLRAILNADSAALSSECLWMEHSRKITKEKAEKKNIYTHTAAVRLVYPTNIEIQ